MLIDTPEQNLKMLNERIVLIHGGATKTGVDLIRKLLVQNEATQNIALTKVICVDKSEHIDKIKEFLNYKTFVFHPFSQYKPLDINGHIDAMFICSDKEEKR